MLLGSHDEIMRVVLVVNDVLKIDASVGVQFLEELLIEDEGDAADLLDARFGFGALVDEVGSYGDGELAPELLAFEALEGVALAVGADQHVELVLRDRVLDWLYLRAPADLCNTLLSWVSRDVQL